MKQLVFFIISLTSFLKHIPQISSHFFWGESAYFHCFFAFLPYLGMGNLKTRVVEEIDHDVLKAYYPF